MNGYQYAKALEGVVKRGLREDDSVWSATPEVMAAVAQHAVILQWWYTVVEPLEVT